MALDFNTCATTAAGNIRTPKVRLSYANLLEPNKKAKTKDGGFKYTVSLLVPPGADIDLLKQAAGDAAVDEFGAEKVKSLREINKFNSPFLDAFAKSRTENNPAGDESLKGWTLLRVSSKSKPGIVGPDGKNVDDASEVYSGRWAFATLAPNAYPAIDGGNPGVNFWLQNIQLLDHDTPLGSGGVRAEDEFAPVDMGGASGGDTGGAKTTDSVFG